MKKLITLAVAVLAGALLFTGCYSEIAPEYNKKSIQDKVASDAEKAEFASRVWSQGSAANLSGYGGPFELTNEAGRYEGNTGKVFHAKCGSWAMGAFVFTSNQNITSATSVTIKVKGTLATAPDAFCYGLEDNNGVQVRLSYDQANVNLTDNYITLTFPIANIIDQDVRNGNATSGFDKSIVKKFIFDPRGAAGDVYIQNITLQ